MIGGVDYIGSKLLESMHLLAPAGDVVLIPGVALSL
jgi:hypothetical protein